VQDVCTSQNQADYHNAREFGILDRDNPEFALILFGTNNNKSESHLPTAMADLAAIIDACARRGAVPVLGTIPPRLGGNHGRNSMGRS